MEARGVLTELYLLTRVMSPAVVMVADLRDDIPRLPLQFQMASNATLGELKRDVEAFLMQDRPRQEVHFLLSLAGGGIPFTAADDPREVWRALPRFSGVDPSQQYVAPTYDLELRWGRWDSTEGRMGIFVKTLTGKRAQVDVNADYYVIQLKKCIHDRVGIPGEQQRPIFDGQQMQDRRLLSDSYRFAGRASGVHKNLGVGWCVLFVCRARQPCRSAVLEASWELVGGLLRASWGLLGWGPLGGFFEASWGPLGAILGGPKARPVRFSPLGPLSGPPGAARQVHGATGARNVHEAPAGRRPAAVEGG